MWLSNSLLKSMEQLKELGVEVDLSQGAHVGRGFADLGYEQFVMIADRVTVSLFNGKRGEIPAGHERFFFRVLSVPECLELLAARGWLAQCIERQDGREFSVVCRRESAEVTGSGRDLLELLVNLLGRALAIGKGNHVG
jgi:hypothetical protein